MNVVTDTWRELVRRRLWPVALLLVAALAAVPLLLAKDAEPVPAPSPVPGANTAPAASDADPIVTMASAEEARRRRVLGASKDPFEPAPMDPIKTATPEPTGSSDAEVEVPSGGSPAPPSGGSAPAPSFPEPSVTPEPEAPKPTFPLYTLTVRFGQSDGTLSRRHVKKLDPLPDAEAPVLVYLGVKEGGKVAVFLVDEGVVAQGDGKCDDPEHCETLEMRVGDTEFLDVEGEEDGESAAQYQLDLVAIKTKKTSSASKARAQYAKVSKKAKKAARARVAVRAAKAMAGGFDVTR